jgi:hypothetical protein
MEVARERVTWGAWDATERYTAKYGELDTKVKKALGGLFAHLLEQGVIVEAGFGKRKNGNAAPIYSLRNAQEVR